MSWDLFVSLLAATILAGTPLLYATLGEMLTERSGVLNLGVEGMMILGAFFAFIVELKTGNHWLAVFAAGLGTACIGMLHGVVCLIFRGNQTVSGLALTIFGVGLSDYLGTPFVGTMTEGFQPFALPLLGQIPLLGPVFFQHNALVYLSYILPPLLWFFLNRTSTGLALCASGEYPDAVSAAGISPARMRWIGIAGGAFLVGLGGAYLSLCATHMWTNNLTAGKGWIAVALVIFAFWRPGRAVVGAWLFGGIMALQLRLQALGTNIPSSFMMMLPYALTIIALLLATARGRGRRAPAALGDNILPGA
ncbi:MAG TPA: ABC transporter permease [Candidatus Mailhella merdavium]|nr:ABC transporter permease [Candidatus Mailhella merdavium]